MTRRGAAAALLVAAGVGLAACGGGTAGPPAELEAPAGNLNVEGARAFVLAEILRFYGEAPDPFIARLDAEPATVDGRRALRLEVTVAFGRAPGREREGWTFWVGFRDGEPGVLRSEGPHPAG